MSDVKYYNIKTPTLDDPTLALLFIGGPLEPSSTPGRVWLVAPGGKRVFEVPANQVEEVDEKFAAAAMADEMKRRKGKGRR